MENVKNLKIGYDNIKYCYNFLLEHKNNDIETWLNLYKDASVLEYWSKDTEIYYNIHSLSELIIDKINKIKKEC